jgi:hypothetical protein
MGVSPATIHSCSVMRNSFGSVFLCTSVPRPHPYFQAFMLTSPKATGVCQLIAVGKNIEDKTDGTSVRLKAGEIATQIAASYGPWSGISDTRTDGKTADNPKAWLAELGDVERIVVQATATDANDGAVGVIIYFSNFDRCTDALKKLTTGADAF